MVSNHTRYMMSDKQAGRWRQSRAKHPLGSVRRSADEAKLAWLQSLHPRAIDHIVVCPAKYLSTWGQESPRDKTVAEFARTLHPEGGFLKRIPNPNYEAVYLVLAKENRKSGQETGAAGE